MASNPVSPVTYLAPPGAAAGDGLPLGRRGVELGRVGIERDSTPPDPEWIGQRWRRQQPTVVPDFLADELAGAATDIAVTEDLVAAILDDQEPEDLLTASPYDQRLGDRFALISSVWDEGDDQEIVTLEFDALDGDEVIAEGLWCKLSWLSFHEHDASLRFRFSFGLANYEDVAADFLRQRLSSELAEAVFPESRLIAANPRLDRLLGTALGEPELAYVERIVYFNGPDGGAQFHQDVERGHLGVVYAQVSGRTLWLALAKAELVAEIQAFMAGPAAAGLDPAMAEAIRDQLDTDRLNQWLDEPDNDPLDQLINATPAFIRQLIEHGHGYALGPGDIMLLPQGDLDACCWHTVFCLGEEMGEALSFAVRAQPENP